MELDRLAPFIDNLLDAERQHAGGLDDRQAHSLLAYLNEKARIVRDLSALAVDEKLAEAAEEFRKYYGCACLGVGLRGNALPHPSGGLLCAYCDCSSGVTLEAMDEAIREKHRAELEARAAAGDYQARMMTGEDNRDMERSARLRAANLPERSSERHFEDFQEPEKRTPLTICRDLAEGIHLDRMERVRFNGKLLAEASARGVFLFGPVGTGKTTLAVLTVRDWVAAGARGLYISLADYLQALRPADGNEMHDAAIERRCTSVDILALDDLGAERLTKWGRDALFRLVNARYNANRPTVYTSNLSPNDLAQVLAGDDHLEALRIMDRIAESCVMVQVDGRNYRR